MAQFKNIFPVNLENGPEKVALRPMHYGDKLANRVGAVVYEGQTPVSLGGYCNATVILSDGSTIAVPNGNVSGNQAYVDLPAGVYSVPGPIQIYLHWYSNGTITTLLAAFGNVVLTETDTVIDPGTVIPGVASLMDMYMSATAPEFAATDDYEKGDYVWHEGVLYRFTANHAAGAWNSSQATAAVIGEDLAELARSNLDYQTLTGKPTANLAPGFGESITISQVKRDSHGNIESLTDRTITMPSSVASTSAAGLMSANDKTKLNNMTPLYYGECTTAAATQEKTVTISGITELYNGLTIFVRFVNAQTYNGIPKLNVNNLGALYIYRSGATAAGATEWQAETVLALTRYENVWFIVDGDRATTGRYGKTILSGNTTSSSTASAVNSAGLREFIENVISNAPIYSDNSAYTEGDYVRKSNGIYRCLNAKAAGSTWVSNDWASQIPIYEIIENLYKRPILYSATCSTAADTQTKTVTIPHNYRDIDGLYYNDGVVINVKFDNAQSYGGTPKLSVDGTSGDIYINDSLPAGVNAWQAGQTMAFRLKRSGSTIRWYIIGSTYDENGIAIAANTNLNNVKTCGLYYTPTSVIGTLSNVPTNGPFMMEVRKTQVNYLNNFAQIVTAWDGDVCKQYIRHSSSSSLTAWERWVEIGSGGGASIPYGTCDSNEYNETKNVTISGVTELENGTMIRVLFTTPQSYDGTPILRLNNDSSTDTPIHFSMSVEAEKGSWEAGEELLLAYHRVEDTVFRMWVIVGHGPAESNSYGLMSPSDKGKLDKLEQGGQNLMLDWMEPVIDDDYGYTCTITRNVKMAIGDLNDAFETKYVYNATRVQHSHSGAYNNNLRIFSIGGQVWLMVNNMETGEDGKKYLFSVWVKNNHATNSLLIRNGIGTTSYKTIGPGETVLYSKLETADTSDPHHPPFLRFDFVAPSGSNGVDVTLFQPSITEGLYRTENVRNYAVATEYSNGYMSKTDKEWLDKLWADADDDFSYYMNASAFTSSSTGKVRRIGCVASINFTGYLVGALSAGGSLTVATLPNYSRPPEDITFVCCTSGPKFLSCTIATTGVMTLKSPEALSAGTAIYGCASWIKPY